jgi:SAM-dependent methyltransferase
VKIDAHRVRQVIDRYEWFREPAKQGYLATSLDRFVHTLNLVPQRNGARVLEIGGVPYFQTVLVRDLFGYEVDVLNEPMWERGPDNRDVLVADDGSVVEIAYRTADIESDRWPFEDGVFDIVLYCEVIEHLVYDPTHTLVEAHRVLKPDGTLLISTPNAISYTAVLDMAMGRNPYPPYSGYNYRARHNRLFTPDELSLLVREVGFEIVDCHTAYDRGYPHPSRLAGAARGLSRVGLLSGRQDVIYLLARRVGQACYAYPSSPPFLLYLDVHGYARCDTGEVVMARHTPQLLDGFYGLEAWGGGIRWTGRRARLYLRWQGEEKLAVSLYTGTRPGGAAVRGWLSLTDEALSFDLRHEFVVAPATWETVVAPVPSPLPEKVIVTIGVENVFVPQQSDPASGDDRELGVAVRDVAFV